MNNYSELTKRTNKRDNEYYDVDDNDNQNDNRLLLPTAASARRNQEKKVGQFRIFFEKYASF